MKMTDAIAAIAAAPAKRKLAGDCHITWGNAHFLEAIGTSLDQLWAGSRARSSDSLLVAVTLKRPADKYTGRAQLSALHSMAGDIS